MKIRFPSIIKSGFNVVDKSVNSNSNSSHSDDRSNCSTSKNNNNDSSSSFISLTRNNSINSTSNSNSSSSNNNNSSAIKKGGTTPKSPPSSSSNNKKNPIIRRMRSMSPLRVNKNQPPRSYPSILNTGKGNKNSSRFYNRQHHQQNNHHQKQQQNQQHQETTTNPKSPSTNSCGSSSSVALSIDSTIISAVDNNTTTTVVALASSSSSSFPHESIVVNLDKNNITTTDNVVDEIDILVDLENTSNDGIDIHIDNDDSSLLSTGSRTRTDNDNNETTPKTETHTTATTTATNNNSDSDSDSPKKDFEKLFKKIIKKSGKSSSTTGIGNTNTEIEGNRNSETVITRDNQWVSFSVEEQDDDTAKVAKKQQQKEEEEEEQLLETKQQQVEEQFEEVCGHGSQWVLNQRFVLSGIGKDIVNNNPNDDDCVAKVDLFKAKRGKIMVNSPLSMDKKSSFDNSDADSDSDDSESNSGSGSGSDSDSDSGSDSSSNNDEDEKSEISNSMNSSVINPPIGSLTIIDAHHDAGGYDSHRTNSKTRNNINNEDDDDDDFGDAKSEGEMTMAQGLAFKLVRDLESVRQENERYTSRNRRLQSQLQILKAQQDEHMIHRGRLLKACIYTSPVFILCGGLDAFLTTILLVWVLIEVDSYMDLGDEGVAGDDEDSVDEDEDDLDNDSDEDDLDNDSDEDSEEEDDDEKSYM
jgi:hypothetical protein